MSEATSDGSPTLPNGCMASETFRLVLLLVIRSVEGVRTNPGATQLNLMFFGCK
jgi:hypothetical protein